MHRQDCAKLRIYPDAYDTGSLKSSEKSTRIGSKI